jgi:hypothetical protein
LFKKKTVILMAYHCSLLLKRLVKLFENNDLEEKAGDEIRTRDSLLGSLSLPTSQKVLCEKSKSASRIDKEREGVKTRRMKEKEVENKYGQLSTRKEDQYGYLCTKKGSLGTRGISRS